MRGEKLLRRTTSRSSCNGIQIFLGFRSDGGRQRIVQGGGGSKKSVFSVAQRYLPGELVGRVRMVKPQKRAVRKRKRDKQAGEEDS